MTARWLLATLTLAACEQTAPPIPSRPWTMFDLAAAFDSEQQVLQGADGFPSGFPYSAFVAAKGPVIPIAGAFTDGGWSPYISTNLWQNMPEVWIQPMYILVERFDDQTHDWVRLKDPATGANAGWIFTVGPKSRYHSPFWRIYFAQVPPGTRVGDYTSSEQILHDRLPLFPGPGRLAPLVPWTSTIGPVPTNPFPIPMFVPPKVRQNDWLDGAPIASIDFGNDRFDWNQDGEVAEQPFFVLVSCRAPGDCAQTKAPNIGGTGPLFARRPAIAPGGRPRFGSFWRLYLVGLPSNGQPGLFIPNSVAAETRDAIHKGLNGLETPAPGFTPDPEHLAQVEKHFMQVALNARTCFVDQASFGKCQWLDSQAAIEDTLPGSITRTGITVTCPFVGYDGMDVKE